jgi:hypothetical protein
MKAWQLILILGILVMGVLAGLVYGWVVNPVEYIDNGLNSLKLDYQTDLVLMTADAYASDLDITTAIQKLYQINGEDIDGLLTDSLEYARQMNFSDQDITKLEMLQSAVIQIIPGGTEYP